jgi:hypothetical protein
MSKVLKMYGNDGVYDHRLNKNSFYRLPRQKKG